MKREISHLWIPVSVPLWKVSREIREAGAEESRRSPLPRRVTEFFGSPDDRGNPKLC